MWLLPAFSTTARLALRTFYRLRIAGAAVPAEGPVLLVANHPNALLDPAAVVAAARRPVRFLAKAPLLSNPQVGWLVRAVGAIPVYRRSDDPGQVERNRDSFRAVFDALGEGAAVGIFPEGISHSEPSLAPLKTGAARIALGAAAGTPFPLLPVGLSLREKGRFRSEALVLVGEPIPWDDLAAAGSGGARAVRQLTGRIDAALREVTVNLQGWEDAPLVAHAVEIYLAERGSPTGPEGRLRGEQEVAAGLARLREGGGGEWESLAEDVRVHVAQLRALGLRPAQLRQPDSPEARRWLARSALLLLLTGPVTALGATLFAPPYVLVRWLAGRSSHTPDVTATFKLLVGGVAHLVWIGLLVTLAAAWLGAPAAVALAVALPLLGLATVRALEWQRSAGGAVRRFLARRRRPGALGELRERQRALALRLAELRTALTR